MPGKPRLGRHESRANSGSELHGSGFGIFVLWERKKKGPNSVEIIRQ